MNDPSSRATIGRGRIVWERIMAVILKNKGFYLGDFGVLVFFFLLYVNIVDPSTIAWA